MRTAHGGIAALAGAGLLALVHAGVALADDGKTEQEDVGEVVVTGTRIHNVTGMSTPTPVTAVTDEELGKMSPGTMVSALSRLPQFYGNTTSEVAVPGSYFTSPGSGNLNLRGLNTGSSSSRTLTLLDGRRVVPANRFGGVDINVLPESLVKRVDTVTGGASAAYGTDAVAGVVNFILDTDYTGLQIHAQGGETSRGDNQSQEYSATFGTGLGERIHLLLNAEHYEHDGVFGYDDRDWYRSWGTVRNPNGTQPLDLLRPNVVSDASTNGGLITAPATSSLNRRQFLPDGSTTPFVLGEGTIAGGSHSISNGGSGDYIGDDMGVIAPDAERDNAFLYLGFDRRTI